MKSRKAVVIGGGIGGLAAAIGLRSIGWDVAAYERVAEPREVGAGLSLWANAVRALRLLGVAEPILARSVPEMVGGIRTPDGTLLAGTSSSDLRALAGETNIVLHRADLHAALLHALGVEHIRFGAACTGFAEFADGVVARFADGSEARADVLVGADGLRSAIRAQLHGDEPPRYAGYTAWREPLVREGHDRAPGETWGAGARFGQVALPGGQVYWFATKSVPPGGRSPDGEKAELLRTFGGWHAPVEALIQASDERAILRNDIFDRPPLGWWGKGRVTLLGDAAHPMTPNLGQGACQALEDAVVLARSLGDEPDVASALRLYEARRIPRTSAIVRQSRQVGAVGQWQAPLAVWARSQLVRYVIPRMQARQVERLMAYPF